MPIQPPLKNIPRAFKTLGVCISRPSWDTTTSAADGHGIFTTSASGSTTGTETGSFTTPPPGTSITPTPDNQAGYATSNETVSLSGTAISQVTMQQWGDANGGSYSGNYVGTASLSYQSSETQTIDVANNIDSKTATYSGDHSQSQNLTYHETGDITRPSFVHEQWTWDYSASSANDTQVSGSDPGTETTTQGSSNSTSQALTLTLTFWDCISHKWGQSSTSSSSGSGGYSNAPTSNTTATGQPGTLGADSNVPAEHNAAQLLCFPAGTPVRTPTGWKYIEEFLPGDMVLASPDSDPECGVEPKQLVRVYANPPDRLIGVHAGGQVIRATLHHPFYVRGAGWTGASRLRPGDQLLSHDGRWLSVTEIFDNGDLEPVYNLCVQDHHTYFVGKPDWGFSVLVHNESGDMKDAGDQQAAQPAAKAKFTEGTGPVLIAGILGRNLAPKVNETFKDKVNNIQTEFNKNIQQPPKGQARQTPAPKPLFYRSSDNTNDVNEAGNDAAIAKDLAKKILKDVADGKLGDGDVYRLLLVGYSWGGDKAIKVANELQRILREGEIITEAINDVRPTSKAAGRLQLFAKTWETKLRVYLATEDAVDSKAKDGGPSTAKPNPGAVYDHFNAFETDDATFEKMPDALHGASFPELGTKNNVNKTTPGTGDDVGKHAAMPGLAQNDLFGWLGLPAPTN